ncbi:MAG: thiamine diphosphokinase [Defluviitaleaceae bacterium]|nr:thiamine diphosphokinase [Defluviitaleaceae bacterium]
MTFFSENIEDASYIICCDGGASFANKIGIVPNLIVGDLDSLDILVKQDYESKNVAFAKFPSDKNATDLELAMEIALQRMPDEVVILGGYGGRPDHFLGNIQTLILAARADARAFLVGSFAKTFVIDKFAEIPRENFDYISLVPLEGEASGVTTTGLKYPLQSDTLNNGTTVGISNEFADDVATVTVDDGLLLAICTRA